ncbi:glycosyltransferase family 2 protein [Grimontia hollisae]|uniref:glycosyltransferase family 2 protein n=1 Tax=Grimontia hollisae TaxID=673 RepID=UPI000E0065FD|nr:glycosyltransferase family A protein [Grimontia hollisae]STQ74765.1 Hyaluronan synthase [Grimontia hollisae]
MKLISIILPVYNGSRYLNDAIQSILAQTYKSWELIIVNDCSTDNSLEIANGWAKKDKRIKIYNNPENLKLPKSLNYGFSVSKGEYLTWTSDDNLLHKDFLLKMKKILDDGYDFAYSNYNLIGDKVGQRYVEHPENILNYNIIGASFMYTRQVYDEIGNYDDTLFLLEDYDYWIRVYQKFSLKRVNDFIYDYRVHGEALSSTRHVEIEMLTSEYILTKILELRNAKSNFSKKQLAIAAFWQVIRMIKLGKYIKILKPMCIGLSCCPRSFLSQLLSFTFRRKR